jgi:hypothetical protein
MIPRLVLLYVRLADSAAARLKADAILTHPRVARVTWTTTRL